MRTKFTRWYASVDAHIQHASGFDIASLTDTGDIYSLFDAGLTARQAAREILADARDSVA